MLDRCGEIRPVKLGEPLATLALRSFKVLPLARSVRQPPVECELVPTVLDQFVEEVGRQFPLSATNRSTCSFSHAKAGVP